MDFTSIKRLMANKLGNLLANFPAVVILGGQAVR